MKLARLDIEELFDRLRDIERRAAEGISMTVGRQRIIRDYSESDDNNHRRHNSNLAKWLRAYIQKRIDDETN